jgi:hypothetical protein
MSGVTESKQTYVFFIKYIAVIIVDVQTLWWCQNLGFDIITEALGISDLSGENCAEKFVEKFWNIYLYFLSKYIKI